MKNSKFEVRTIVESAVMLALAFALSYVKLYRMPWGGSVTLFSMLPIIVVSIRHGIAWGTGTAFCYSWLQVFLGVDGNVFGWGLTPGMLVGSIILDYIVAFTVIGLAGIFRKMEIKGAFLGTVAVCVARFLSHFIAGVVLWANVEQFVAFGESFVNRPVLYSFLYNGAYMLPEMIITVAGLGLLLTTKEFRKIIFNKNARV